MTTSFENVPAPSVQAYMIYLVLDTSKSMWLPRPRGGPESAPLKQFERLIPRMLRVLADHPVTNKLASISVVAFNDRPEILRPISSLEQAATIAKPSKGYGTDYASMLKFLVGQHRKDVREVKKSRSRQDYGVDIARPWIFVITDGRAYAQRQNQADSEWLKERDRLIAPPIEARVVTLGLPGADDDALWLLATGDETGKRNAFIARDTEHSDELSKSVIDAIGSSISTSAGSGTLTIKTPVGMDRVEGPRHARD
ncbi:vWA domain-containing protein [Actinoplanes sp. CA-142083]|uniref:vWA domain-containing protein n=1 Tax=Actinoplanes sp. CA-142083 TaxID=3239903 RepID=UPI003D8F008B